MHKVTTLVKLKTIILDYSNILICFTSHTTHSLTINKLIYKTMLKLNYNEMHAVNWCIMGQ